MRIKKNIIKISIYIVTIILLISCSQDIECKKDDDEIYQFYKSYDKVAQLIKIDHGAFGITYNLGICENNVLVEEIVLRGDDYPPTIDSIVGDKIYVHYAYPNVENSKLLNFENVVLGEALKGEKKIKFNYIFSNRNVK